MASKVAPSDIPQKAAPSDAPPTIQISSTWPDPDDYVKLVDDLQNKAKKDIEAYVDVAAIALKLETDLTNGLPVDGDFGARIDHFGGNFLEKKKLMSYCEYLWEALHDKLMIMLLTMATLELVIKMIKGPASERSEAWIEPVAIYCTVLFIINIQSILDYNRSRAFERLSEKVAASNLRNVVRGGQIYQMQDEDIVVGDILSFDSHVAPIIPADCLMINGDGVKADESALTGEPEPIAKNDKAPLMISGTTVNAGKGKMLVIAVGELSVSGKIRAQVYGHDEEEEESPLFTKLDALAGMIGTVGVAVAAICFVAQCVINFGIGVKNPETGERERAEADKLLEYFIEAMGILIVAIPEGLPVALTISLAFSSEMLAEEQNLVKTLSACETMGSATTICTDKTGTLTENKMTVKGSYFGDKLIPHIDAEAHVILGKKIQDDEEICPAIIKLASDLMAICTMDESTIQLKEERWVSNGNPTECALLYLCRDLGNNYEAIRKNTKGRSDDTLHLGKCNSLTSARKAMSWAVPKENGEGYMVYVKGAAEVILERCTQRLNRQGKVQPLTTEDKEKIAKDVILNFASQAMRNLTLAYREVPNLPGGETRDDIKNVDGSPAYECETELIFVAIVGIEDPLREEVPGAIEQCYTAGIDVRMVTGDNLNTAVAIAKQAGILKAEHLDADGKPKKYRAMDGMDFRKLVVQDEVADHHAEFHHGDAKHYKKKKVGDIAIKQHVFDEIWPYLRVMARCSPDDKLTLAKGLKASEIYKDKKRMAALKDEGVKIFPDGQVVAMTGDGTNDAPALKEATVGFAMNIAGTQIAKDAANIILLDDNFKSIVTAAKWGRNVYDSIQKFMQFQLTVNIAILALSLIRTFAAVTESPLSIMQMLWLNLIMDSLAAVALASEPPTEAQLKRPPVNKSVSIITPQMFCNMVGQAAYQVCVISWILFNPDKIPDYDMEDKTASGVTKTGLYTYHYTIIFNTFVLMQLFNEYNSRMLQGEWNIFRNIHKNTLFIKTNGTTIILQCLMTMFAGKVLKIHESQGLTLNQWIFSLAFSIAPWVWQLVINALVLAGKEYNKRYNVMGLTETLKFGGSKHRTKMVGRTTTMSGVLEKSKSARNQE